MANKQRTRRDSSKRLVMNTALVQTADSEMVEFLENIECLQAILRRFAALLDNESIEVVALTQADLKTISDWIRCVLTFHSTHNSREQLQNWDNEGGRIEYESA